MPPTAFFLKSTAGKVKQRRRGSTMVLAKVSVKSFSCIKCKVSISIIHNKLLCKTKIVRRKKCPQNISRQCAYDSKHLTDTFI